MKYVSIDIETTGLNHEQDQILEFGAVVEDTLRQDVPVQDLPTFRRIIKHKQIHGSLDALILNANLLKEIQGAQPSRDGETGCIASTTHLAGQFAKFLAKQGIEGDGGGIYTYVVAGKNFSGFDQPFLIRVPGWKNIHKPYRRVLDPAILYFNPLVDDKPPSLGACLRLAGFDPVVSHGAVEDAMNVIRVLRHAFATRKSAGIIGAS